jgi:hypothetical protein
LNDIIGLDDLVDGGTDDVIVLWASITLERKAVRRRFLSIVVLKDYRLVVGRCDRFQAREDFLCIFDLASVL